MHSYAFPQETAHAPLLLCARARYNFSRTTSAKEPYAHAKEPDISFPYMSHILKDCWQPYFLARYFLRTSQENMVDFLWIHGSFTEMNHVSLRGTSTIVLKSRLYTIIFFYVYIVPYVPNICIHSPLLCIHSPLCSKYVQSPMLQIWLCIHSPLCSEYDYVYTFPYVPNICIHSPLCSKYDYVYIHSPLLCIHSPLCSKYLWPCALLPCELFIKKSLFDCAFAPFTCIHSHIWNIGEYVYIVIFGTQGTMYT